jgi:predicted RNA-binding Zn-ribbon protein involved in translation (DUF1610 family)
MDKIRCICCDTILTKEEKAVSNKCYYCLNNKCARCMQKEKEN